MVLDLDDVRPTMIDQLRPAVADADPDGYERDLWATRVLAELESDADNLTG